VDGGLERACADAQRMGNPRACLRGSYPPRAPVGQHLSPRQGMEGMALFRQILAEASPGGILDAFRLHDYSVASFGGHAPILCRNATTLPR
jgi:hypothetical protein